MFSLYLQLDEVAEVVHDLAYGKRVWADIEKQYPKFEQQESKGV